MPRNRTDDLYEHQRYLAYKKDQARALEDERAVAAARRTSPVIPAHERGQRSRALHAHAEQRQQYLQQRQAEEAGLDDECTFSPNPSNPNPVTPGARNAQLFHEGTQRAADHDARSKRRLVEVESRECTHTPAVRALPAYLAKQPAGPGSGEPAAAGGRAASERLYVEKALALLLRPTTTHHLS